MIIGLASRAPLTFFDEPYLGLDAVARQLFYDRLLADYAEHPRTVVLSTHLIDEVSDCIEHVVVIDRGRMLIDEDADDAARPRGRPSPAPADAVERVRDRPRGAAPRAAGRLPAGHAVRAVPEPATRGAGWSSSRSRCSSSSCAPPSRTHGSDAGLASVGSSNRKVS